MALYEEAGGLAGEVLSPELRAQLEAEAAASAPVARGGHRVSSA